MSTFRNGEIYVSSTVKRALRFMHKAGMGDCPEAIAERILMEGIQRDCPCALELFKEYAEKEESLLKELAAKTNATRREIEAIANDGE